MVMTTRSGKPLSLLNTAMATEANKIPADREQQSGLEDGRDTYFGRGRSICTAPSDHPLGSPISAASQPPGRDQGHGEIAGSHEASGAECICTRRMVGAHGKRRRSGG